MVLTFVSLLEKVSTRMSGLVEAIRRCNVQLKLDNNTEGYGNCFPNAIIQQCRRPVINKWLHEKNPIGIFKSPQALRRQVSHFALNSKHKNVNDYKRNYETILSKTDKTWTEYWENIERNETWVDSVFIQITAWLIGLDIQILTTSSKPDNPYIFISANIDNPAKKSSGPPMLVGNYTNVHYQSLIPINNEFNIKGYDLCQEKDKKFEILQESFIYSYEGVQITFPKLHDEKFHCPFCKKNFSRIMSHVSSRQCTISQSNINIKEFGNQFSAFREGFRLEMGRKRKQKSRMKLILEKGKDAIKWEQNELKAKSRIKSRVEKGPSKVRKEQNAWELQSRKRKMESDLENVQTNELRWKKLSRTKQKLEAPEKFRKDQWKWNQKRRLIDTEKKRLEKFIRKTMYNAIFTCMCCHRNRFECNVVKFTE